MKKLLNLFALIVLVIFTQCNKSKTNDDRLFIAHQMHEQQWRGQIISELLNNDDCMNQVMDSMRTKHPDVILSTVFVIAKTRPEMQMNMMDNMMKMCNEDTAVCKMMITKMTVMCEQNPAATAAMCDVMTDKK